jgi:hypothetical protein
MITFSLLGIFGLKYRKLAWEAFNCVARRITLRPCQSRLDQKLKAKLTAKLMKFPRIAKLWYGHFEAISWTLVILTFISLFFTIRGLFNLAIYGACEPHSQCPLQLGTVGCEGISCQIFVFVKKLPVAPPIT